MATFFHFVNNNNYHLHLDNCYRLKYYIWALLLNLVNQVTKPLIINTMKRSL